MYKTKLDARTIETRIRERTNNDFCTYQDIEEIMGLSYDQVRRLLNSALNPVTNAKPRKFYTPHVAQVLASSYS